MPPRRLTEQQLTDLIREVIENARRREAMYLPRALPLSPQQKQLVANFFPERLLDEVRILELKDEHLPNPPFQQRAGKGGYRMMLDFTHKAQIAHPRLIIFQQELTPRLLFHALVHVMQYAILGLERYLDLYVRAFSQSGSYTNVPMEVQAFGLDQRFTEQPDRVFSAEGEVRGWADNGKYVLEPTGAKKHGL